MLAQKLATPLSLSTPKPLTLRPNPILTPKVDVSIAKLEREMDTKRKLTADQRLFRKSARAELIDATQTRDAIQSIERLPEADESLHILAAGQFSLFHIVPAALELANEPLADLGIATLGFSRRNIDRLCQLVDSNQIGRVRLVFSHFFKGTSTELFDHAIAEFAKRPERMYQFSCRTHCKLMLFAFASGRKLSAESSANLRSCRNVEQITLHGDPKLYDFYSAWVDSVFKEGEASGEDTSEAK